MKIEIKMTETVEEIIDRICEKEGIFSYEYASVTNGNNVARVLIGGDVLHNIYFDVYANDEEEATTFWVGKNVSVGKAFALAMNCAMSRVIGEN